MMKKLISGLVLLAMLACLVLPAAAAEPTALPMTVAEAVDAAGRHTRYPPFSTAYSGRKPFFRCRHRGYSAFAALHHFQNAE